jgi:hypothetical protein
MTSDTPVHSSTPRTRFLIGLILATAALRLLPHPWNFTPIGAMALFAGTQFRDRRIALAIPLAALWLSDAWLGFHRLMPFVYASMGVNVLLGMWNQRHPGHLQTIGASILGSLQFFLITNFSVWTVLDSYPRTISGLMECYIAGLPFLRNAMAGDLFYTTLLFSTLALAERWNHTLREPEAKSPIPTAA